MIKCKICGSEFNACKEKHYISRDEGKYGISAVAGGNESKIYDTFDCPSCGCQIVIQERKRCYARTSNGDKDKEDKNSGKK